MNVHESRWKWINVDKNGWKYQRCYIHFWCRTFVCFLHESRALRVALSELKLHWSCHSDLDEWKSHKVAALPCKSSSIEFLAELINSQSSGRCNGEGALHLEESTILHIYGHCIATAANYCWLVLAAKPGTITRWPMSDSDSWRS